jgi:hypothetical protein
MFFIEHAKLSRRYRLLRFDVAMGAQGRFGKYGDHKRKSGLRKNRVLKSRLQKISLRKSTQPVAKARKHPRGDERLS